MHGGLFAVSIVIVNHCFFLVFMNEDLICISDLFDARYGLLKNLIILEFC